MYVLVDEIGREVLEPVGLEVEVLQLPLVVEGSLCHQFDPVVVQGQPQEFVQRLNQTLGEVLGATATSAKAKADLQVLQRGSKL